ncbi:XRE family transcriptional regulator [Nocardia panacis]|uniref:XRE family transcriptional regulator n=1 Tax=Nocardia panacis TaxID=2340916 RepID=A0A3A4JVP3_9NOCA|nr:helix-turn-helix transcriptional regulator [Nocardia panacis]RJO70612.1 XRE family transcriptional regulator [Nocardia panacis]
MNVIEHDNIGGIARKLPELRKLAGKTQPRLAAEANVSLSLLKKVEQGKVPASPAFISTVARALKVGIADLTQQPYPRTTRDEQQVHAGISDLRRELAAYRLDPDDDLPARPFAQLATDVAKASLLRHAVRLGDLGTLLPSLLADLRIAWTHTTGTDRERLFGLAAETYAAASQVAYKLGYIDLSSLAVDRYEWAAALSGDELLVLCGDYQRAGELLGTADWNTATRLLEHSRGRIEPSIGTADERTLSMWGNLHLKSALVAARTGNRDLADAHLTEATETAQRIGQDLNHFQLCFGPTNVAIWSVGLAVEMMDGTTAITRAADVRIPKTTPHERAGHHYIDLARGYLLHGDRPAAFGALQKAKTIGATQTRYHPMVHETIRVLAREEARSTESVRGFAAWCGIIQ